MLRVDEPWMWENLEICVCMDSGSIFILHYCSFRILMPMFTMHIKLEGAKYMNTGITFYPRLENKLKKWFEMNFETGLH